MSLDLARKLRRNSTEPERRMWAILWHFRQEGWHFRRQVQLGPHYAGFACLHAGLVIEIDGDTHGSDKAIAADAARDEYLTSCGLLVKRYSNRDVIENPEGVFQDLAGVLNAVRRVKNSPTPVPSPQGGGRPSRSTPAASQHELAVPSSPSPLREGDRGGGAY